MAIGKENLQCDVGNQSVNSLNAWSDGQTELWKVNIILLKLKFFRWEFQGLKGYLL